MCPACCCRLKATSGVPGHVDRTYHAPDCSPGQLAARSDPAQVSGGNTLKYYRKPQLYRSGQPSLAGHASHTTTLGAPGPHQQLHGAADASQYAAAAARAAASAHAAMPGVMSAAASMPESAGPKSRTVGTQSEYRDSEAQTGPWTPGYILPAAVTARQAALSQRNNCEGPELLQLAGMDFELVSGPQHASMCCWRLCLRSAVAAATAAAIWTGRSSYTLPVHHARSYLHLAAQQRAMLALPLPRASEWVRSTWLRWRRCVRSGPLMPHCRRWTT
jgi:hypothetical protein